MLDLDRRFDQATSELRHQLDAVHPVAADTLVRRARRRRRTRVGFGAVGTAAALVATLATGVGRQSPGLGVSGDAAASRFLYPASAAGTSAAVDAVIFGPSSGSGPRAVVRTPSGTVFVVAIGPRFGAEPTPGLPQRLIGGRTYTVESSRGTLAYTSYDDCEGITLQQSSPGASPFDSDTLTMLDGLAIAGQNLTVAVPAGWEATEVGAPGTLVQLTFGSSVVPGAGFALLQLPDTSVASLLGGVAVHGPLVADELVDGRPAWSSIGRNNDGSIPSPPATAFTTIAWQNGPDAAVLYSAQATVDELKRVVATLEPGHPKAFAGYAPTARSASEGTAPTTLPPPEARTVPAAQVCAAPVLTLTR